MKKLLLAAWLFIVPIAGVFAQASDRALEQMMTRRVLTQQDVALNIASLVPGLYKANRVDTIKQLLSYYERNYLPASTVTPLRILLDIKEREFNEQLTLPRYYSSSGYSDTTYYEENIMPVLRSFYVVCSNMVIPGAYAEDIGEQYAPYLSFLGRMAQDMKSMPGLKPVEQFLVSYFAHPSDTAFRQLDDPLYAGTRLQRAWMRERHQHERIGGLSLGLTTGAWSPLGNLSLVGTHPYFGFVAGARGARFSAELNLIMRFLRSANYYTVVAEKQVFNTRYYSGGYIGVDAAYELWRKERHGIELVGGVAVDFLDALKSNSKDKDAVTKELVSVNFNLGLGYRFFLRQSRKMDYDFIEYKLMHRISYLAFHAKYNVINYKNDGGTPLDGHALTFGIIYGAYSRPANKK